MSMFSLIIGAVLNIILDPIMIFGLFGCPAMGIRGAAIATVIGQMAGAVAALLLNRFCNPLIHVRLRDYHFSWQDVADIYRVGLPTIVMQAIGSVMTFAVNHILLDVSATAVAFFGIYYKLQNFLMMPINGLGNGIINMVSAAIRQLVLLVPFLWIFINLWGISRGWYAFWIAESIACIYSDLSSHQLLKILRNTSRTNGPTKNT